MSEYQNPKDAKKGAADALKWLAKNLNPKFCGGRGDPADPASASARAAASSLWARTSQTPGDPARTQPAKRQRAPGTGVTANQRATLVGQYVNGDSLKILTAPGWSLAEPVWLGRERIVTRNRRRPLNVAPDTTCGVSHGMSSAALSVRQPSACAPALRKRMLLGAGC